MKVGANDKWTQRWREQGGGVGLGGRDLGGPREVGHGAVLAYRLVEQSHLVSHLLTHVEITAPATTLEQQ